MTTAVVSSRSVLLTVQEVVQETPEAVTIVFERPADPRFAHRPGQFLTLRIPSDRTGSVARCYSLCSAPHDHHGLAVTVKRIADGYGSNWVYDNVDAGSSIEVLPPSGTFTPDSLDTDLLLIGGGSGITPLMSILRSVLETGSGTITLVYANRDESSVIFAAALQDLVAQHPDRLTVLHWINSVQGTPTLPTLTALLRPFSQREAFVCGPAAFMDAAHTALEGLGVPRDRIHLERFRSLSGDPFEDPDLELSATDFEEASSLTVSLNGQTHSLDWPRSASLVDLLLAKDIDVPYSCREGECGSCVCNIVDGEVEMAFSDTLDPADIADGYILGCQARPVSDQITIEF